MAARQIDHAAREMGKRLRTLREERHLTQREVAQRLGLTEAGYSHIEHGRTRISTVDVAKFAEALDLSSESLAERLGIIGAVVRSAGSFPQEDFDRLTPQQQEEVRDFIRWKRRQLEDSLS